MKYTLKEVDGVYRLHRHGEIARPSNGAATNAELEFWFEIERLREERDQLLVLVRHASDVINSSDAEHPNFLDSGADSIDLLWRMEDEIRAAAKAEFYNPRKKDDPHAPVSTD